MADDDFLEFVREQLREVEGLVARPMFGCHGLYAGERFFGIVCDGRLYFKTDERSREEYTRRGSEPFRASEKQVLKTYYEVPADVLESRKLLAAWASRAVGASSVKARGRKRRN